MANSKLAAEGRIRVVDGQTVEVIDGDLSAMVGQEFDAQPVKSQKRTILDKIGDIEADGQDVGREALIYEDCSVEDCVVSLQNMTKSVRNKTLSALEGLGEDGPFEDIVNYVSNRIPGNIKFIPAEDN